PPEWIAGHNRQVLAEWRYGFRLRGRPALGIEGQQRDPVAGGQGPQQVVDAGARTSVERIGTPG
ncbi:hypothetical protein ACFLTC_00620, partial [Chloroflexota bacterium]